MCASVLATLCYLRYIYVFICVSLQSSCVCDCLFVCVCVCLSDTQVIGPLLLCRRVARLLPRSQRWCKRVSQQGRITHLKRVAVIFRLMSAIGNNKTLFLCLSERRQSSFWQREYGRAPNLWHSGEDCSACGESTGPSSLFLATSGIMDI